MRSRDYAAESCNRATVSRAPDVRRLRLGAHPRAKALVRVLLCGDALEPSWLDDMEEDRLTLLLDRDMRLFLRRRAELAARSGDLVASEEPARSAEYIELVLRAQRTEAWQRALRVLQTADWLGAEIFAAIDVGARHGIDSEEAEAEIVNQWTHIQPRRWRHCVVLWLQKPEIGEALVDIAMELDSEDPDCKHACLAIYDRPTLWSRLRRRPPSTYAKLKRIGSDRFVAVRLG